MVKSIKFSERLRKIILDSGIPRLQISKATGIDPAVLHRFVKGQRGLSIESIDALALFFDLKVIAKRKGK